MIGGNSNTVVVLMNEGKFYLDLYSVLAVQSAMQPRKTIELKVLNIKGLSTEGDVQIPWPHVVKKEPIYQNIAKETCRGLSENKSLYHGDHCKT